MDRAAAAFAGPNGTRERVEVRFHHPSRFLSFFLSFFFVRFPFAFLLLFFFFFFFDNEPNSRAGMEKSAR
jgi:hypothetical protein